MFQTLLLIFSRHGSLTNGISSHSGPEKQNQSPPLTRSLGRLVPFISIGWSSWASGLQLVVPPPSQVHYFPVSVLWFYLSCRRTELLTPVFSLTGYTSPIFAHHSPRLETSSRRVPAIFGSIGGFW